MVQHKPLHPGEIVRDALFTETDLNVTTAASGLGVSRSTLSRLLNGRAGISPEMALRLALFLDTSVEMWLNIQRDYDMWQVECKRHAIRVMPYTLSAGS